MDFDIRRTGETWMLGRLPYVSDFCMKYELDAEEVRRGIARGSGDVIAGIVAEECKSTIKRRGIYKVDERGNGSELGER